MTAYEQGFMSKCAEYGLNEVEATTLLKIAVEKLMGLSKPTAGGRQVPTEVPMDNPVVNGLQNAADWIRTKFPGTSGDSYTPTSPVGQAVKPVHDMIEKTRGGLQGRIERYNDFATKYGPGTGAVDEYSNPEYNEYVNRANSFWRVPAPTGKPAMFDQQ